MSQPSWVTPSDVVTASGTSHSSHAPSAMPVEYDSFAAYQPGLSASFTDHDTYLPPIPSFPAYSQPPTTSGVVSSRTSLLPTRSSFGYASDQSNPRLRPNDASPYYMNLDKAHYQVPGLTNNPYSEVSSFSQTVPSDMHDKSASAWAKSDGDLSQFYETSPTQRADLTGDRRILKTSRTKRPPRKHTTKEEANFQCEVKGCGKFFSRSYNYKSHLETHDEKREYPFPCPVHDCNKKFVRKTDLQRHHQSVHMKERNHKCDYCGRLFARKDTLRRHMEDGCSKRFDIGTLNLQSESFEGLSLMSRPASGSRHGL